MALAAKLFGVPATVVMPTTVTAAKRAGAERLGARVVLAGTTTADRMDARGESCGREGATLVPPYDDPRIIAGQGTAGLEIVEDLPDVGTVLVPVGGGGFSAGVATAVKLLAAARARDRRRAGGRAQAHARARAPARRCGSSAPAASPTGCSPCRSGTIPFAHHPRYIDDVVHGRG